MAAFGGSRNGGGRQGDYEQKDNTGALFPNDKKESDKHPDLRGQVMIEGRKYWISAWEKRSKAGKDYLSLAVQRQDEQRRESYSRANDRHDEPRRDGPGRDSPSRDDRRDSRDDRPRDRDGGDRGRRADDDDRPARQDTAPRKDDRDDRGRDDYRREERRTEERKPDPTPRGTAPEREKPAHHRGVTDDEIPFVIALMIGSGLLTVLLGGTGLA